MTFDRFRSFGESPYHTDMAVGNLEILCNGLGLAQIVLVRVGIAHVRPSIYVAQPTSDSQFSAVLPLSSHRYILRLKRAGI
jgi:hypothetical protein